MLFTEFIFAALSLTPAVMSAPHLSQGRQSSPDSIQVAPGSAESSIQKRSVTTATDIPKASLSAQPTPNEHSSMTQMTADGKPSNRPSVSTSPTNSSSNGDTVKSKWDGGEGPYLVYTILQYVGLTTPQPNVLEKSLDQASYEVNVNVDASHDTSSVVQ
uniref:Uncharacterized protein n=1 Tax=Kwoniella pini CBS 10737 TaxID=1296096 RepID=A0A1B9IEB3_9TREE|nr:uncharacterized protein I206_01203 [Kwoniella pini CBS 10737]OCF53896.1 hypothetical protein I206_01203 [Kwoniella pini CBS 10737]